MISVGRIRSHHVLKNRQVPIVKDALGQVQAQEVVRS